MFQDVNAFFTAFGASVIVPVMIFIIALFLKVQPRMAMMSLSLIHISEPTRP